jgi:mRNA-degrading endonuclease RelE of RelBE toxin-antitoxin system
MREFELKPDLEKKLKQLFKRDNSLYTKLMRKIEEILNSEDISHYKNLRYDMKESQRVHIGHFVLVFSYDPTKDFISFEDFEHHNKIYAGR